MIDNEFQKAASLVSVYGMFKACVSGETLSAGYVVPQY